MTAKSDKRVYALGWSAEEASESIGICAKGLIASDAPRVKIGRRVVFPIGPLEEWLRKKSEPENGEVAPQEEPPGKPR